MTKVDYAELAARLAPFLAGYIGPSTTVGSPIIPIPTQYGIRLVRAGTGFIEWFPATPDGFFGANAASADGDAILVPPGTYEFTERLTVLTNISIIGENMQTCVIENHAIAGSVGLLKGGSFQNFTFNSTREASGAGAVMWAYGEDYQTNTFINVPYIENVTFNLTLGGPNVNWACIALYWHWEQDYSHQPLAGAKSFTAVKDVYITVVDNRVGVSYGADGYLALYDANGGTMVSDNVNVTLIAGYTNLLAIELEPVYENRGRLEVRNCSVDVRAIGYSTYGSTSGFYILWTNMYDCKAYVAGLDDATGVYVSGGPILIRDSEIYVEGSQYVYGIETGWPESVDIINCQVEAVTI